MGTTRLTSLVLVAGLALAVCLQPASAAEFEGDAQGDAVTLTGREARATAKAAAAIPVAERLVEYKYADACLSSLPTHQLTIAPCTPTRNLAPLPNCEGLAPVRPLWQRTRATPADSWSNWRLVADASCPQDDLPAFTAADFRRLPLAPPTLRVQPDTGRVLVNLPLITVTDPTPQLLFTDLLGYDVEVDATPTSYSWDFGDGSAPLVTTSPGHPYPGHDVSHAYVAAGTFRVTLTVTYSGRYRLAGTTTWLPVAGTASTTATSPPIVAEEAPSRLVATDCTADPRPAGC